MGYARDANARNKERRTDNERRAAREEEKASCLSSSSQGRHDEARKIRYLEEKADERPDFKFTGLDNYRKSLEKHDRVSADVWTCPLACCKESQWAKNIPDDGTCGNCGGSKAFCNEAAASPFAEPGLRNAREQDTQLWDCKVCFAANTGDRRLCKDKDLPLFKAQHAQFTDHVKI